MLICIINKPLNFICLPITCFPTSHRQSKTASFAVPQAYRQLLVPFQPWAKAYSCLRTCLQDSIRWRWFGQPVTKMYICFAGNFAEFWQPECSPAKARNGSRKNLAWRGWKKWDEATVSFPTKYCWATQTYTLDLVQDRCHCISKTCYSGGSFMAVTY